MNICEDWEAIIHDPSGAPIDSEIQDRAIHIVNCGHPTCRKREELWRNGPAHMQGAIRSAACISPMHSWD